MHTVTDMLRSASSQVIACGQAKSQHRALTDDLRACLGDNCPVTCACAVLLQVGVKQGGCSGMSYVMDFEQPENIKGDDYVIEYEGGAFKLACDPKSLL